MIPAGPIVALLMSLAPCAEDRAEAGLPERLELIGQAIGSVSETHAEAAALVTIAWHESRFCRSVHSGAKRGGLGQGLWQLEPGSRRAPPFAGLAFKETQHAASEALWLWRHSFQCGSSPAARFRGYAGVSCNSGWHGATERARYFYWVLSKL